MSVPLQFAPFSSTLDAGFWHKLSQLKLDVYGLQDASIDIRGYYSNCNAVGIRPCITLDYSAFSSSFALPPHCFVVNGSLKNTNTIESFVELDKKQFINCHGHQLWNDIKSGKCITDPECLTKLLLLTFCDLKRYKYHYWLAFTALCYPADLQLLQPPTSITQRFSDIQMNSLIESYDLISQSQHLSAFVIRENETSLSVFKLHEFESLAATSTIKLLIGFCDPCTLDSNPGWPLRNLLALCAYHWESYLKDGVEVVCLRDSFKNGVRSVSQSIVLKIQFTGCDRDIQCPKVVGWERNNKQQLTARVVDLSSSMDPVRIAESSVDLNLKLMRWRLAPDIDLQKISSAKCLLLGSGTLGCNVARCLLGWGVRHITLVDNSTVSFSNPVRQSLFEFKDSLNGGRPKAIAAAESLKRIFPGVDATGVELSIPMPGHSVPDQLIEDTRSAVSRLEELIAENDIIFLLMDTRESRWLPSVIGAAKQKLVLSAALGFDTYLAIRHGMRILSSAAAAGDGNKNIVSGDDLGCYFCNDVVAPGNSVRDRTLDQQCTVSRPGLSLILGGLVTEVAISLLIHPRRGSAPADMMSNRDERESSTECYSQLGLVPHQIRGFLSYYQTILPVCRSFDKCIACSSQVIRAYQDEGFGFLLKVFNNSSYLEELTGLRELLNLDIDHLMLTIDDVDDDI